MVSKIKSSALKTPFAVRKEERELAVYNDGKELTVQPDAMKEAVNRVIMEKYDIAAPSTIWAIVRRVERRFAGKESV